ncbi:MAG TPA: excinuclease ABC subunit UvrA [Salinivirgaceae bacterium]|nr:excinuclease ABC subunit UvrA [Salinivirgaceae bacterium]
MAQTDEFIQIKGAKVHNLKNVDLQIPRNKFIVITGVSGSGKSSLAFDTLYAEGQRRYVESLSSYARQFLGRINKPSVDFIHGIPPAIAIEQKATTGNPRSTVGTMTEVYDYLRLLFARIGKTYSPISGRQVVHHTVSDVVDFLASYPEGTKAMILAPFPHIEKSKMLSLIKSKGYQRFFIQNQIVNLQYLEENLGTVELSSFYIVIDRVIASTENDNLSRIADSVQIAFFEGGGRCAIYLPDNQTSIPFSEHFELDGMEFIPPSEHLFNFNSPAGACARCEGYGQTIGIDENLVVPDKNLSIYQGAIACWRGEKMREWNQALVLNAAKFDFPIHKPYFELTEEQRKLLWTGNQYFGGLNAFFQMLEENSYKIQYRVLLSRYKGKTRCPECNGTRLKKEASYIKIDGYSLPDLVNIPIDKLSEIFSNLRLNDYEKQIADRLLFEIQHRLLILTEIGLGYLTLNRRADTLSGGEAQRIRLSTSLGSSLVGSLYILDEPSIGLHSRDTERLIRILKKLRNAGNTVVVVEHDEEIIRSADYLVDIGPFAGINGGTVVFSGTPQEFSGIRNSITLDYLTGAKQIKPPAKRRSFKQKLIIEGARHNNLKNINVEIPLNVLTVVTGVSGSGKSSLIKGILVPAMEVIYNQNTHFLGDHNRISGNIEAHQRVEFVDQNPVGRSSRSNPVTYIKAFDEIRKLFAEQQLSKQMNFKPSHFSFNIEGGRCETCKGDGIIVVPMQFMADVELVCDDCNGKRFKDEILEVSYHGKSIYDVLEMTVSEAIAFFNSQTEKAANKIAQKLKPLEDVGLDYVKLGQSSSTFSGGEIQRLKLAFYLSKDSDFEGQKILFIFDEPTTGLHIHDVQKLLRAFDALLKNGHSVVVIEHNLEVIKSADWIIDLGPEGGINGGYLVASGTPEDVAQNPNSITGKFLRSKLNI